MCARSTRLQTRRAPERNTAAGSGNHVRGKDQRADTLIDWRAGAHAIDRQIRALNPSPGAAAALNGQHLKIWAAETALGQFGSPGTVVGIDDAGIVVASGDGALVIRELQRAGGKRMPAAAYVAGSHVEVNARFGELEG